VIDYKVDGDQWFDNRGVGSLRDGCIPHGGNIDQQGNPGEILQDDASYRERNLVGSRVAGVPPRKILHILGGDLLAVHIPHDGLEDDPDRDRQAVEVWEALLGKGGRRASTRDLANRYWGPSTRAGGCTRGAWFKLQAWRVAAAIPLALSLPVLAVTRRGPSLSGPSANPSA